MAANLDQVYEQAMRLPDESKAVLAERIIEYLETNVNPNLERAHLDIVKKRREEIREKRVDLIPGEDALAKVRQILNP
jgi:hypothetical protein